MILDLLTVVKYSNLAPDLAQWLRGSDLCVKRGLLRCRHAYETKRDY
mgnify:CR=1 FL=1